VPVMKLVQAYQYPELYQYAPGKTVRKTMGVGPFGNDRGGLPRSR